MKIGLVLWGLMESCGGIQRVGINLAEEMLQRGHNVCIFYNKQFRSSQEYPAYPLPEATELVGLDMDSGTMALLENRQAFLDSRIEVLIAMFSWRDLMWFPWMLNTTGIPLICSEHNFPPVISNIRWNPYEHFGCLATADRIHVLSEAYVKFYPKALHERIEVIPNCAPQLHEVDCNVRKCSPRRTVLAAGRFNDDHKQFSILIKSFAKIAGTYPLWDLVICGEGRDAEKYKKLITELRMDNRIMLPGVISDMEKYYRESHAFCLPSKFEGQPMVILEAASFGLPFVAFKNCAAIENLIVHARNGLLAECMDIDHLAKTLSAMMSGSDDDREKMGSESQILIQSHSTEAVYDRWEKMILKTTKLKMKTKIGQIWNSRFPPDMLAAAVMEYSYKRY